MKRQELYEKILEEIVAEDTRDFQVEKQQRLVAAMSHLHDVKKDNTSDRFKI